MSTAAAERWVCEVCGRLNRGWSACAGCATGRGGGPEASGTVAPESRAGGEAPDPSAGEIARSGDQPAESPLAQCPHCGQMGLRTLDPSLAQCDGCGQLAWLGEEPRLPLERRQVRLHARPGEGTVRARGRRVSGGRWTRGRGQGQRVAWILLVAAILMTATLTAIVIVAERRKQRETRMEANLAARTDRSEQVPWLKDGVLFAETRAVVLRYCAAASAQELASAVVDGEMLKQRLDAWMLSERPPKIEPSEVQLIADQVRALENDFWLVPVTSAKDRSIRRNLVVRVEAGNCRVDWAGSEGIGEMDWNRWLLTRPRQPQTMRLVAREVEATLPPGVTAVPGTRLFALRHDFGEGLGVIVLAEPGSTLERRLDEVGLSREPREEASENRVEVALGRREQGVQEVALTLRLHFPEDRQSFTDGNELAVLDEVVRGDWLAYPAVGGAEGDAASGPGGS